MNNKSKVLKRNGKLHSFSGPAVIHANGDKEYWIGGIEYTPNQWRELVKEINGTALLFRKFHLGEIDETTLQLELEQSCEISAIVHADTGVVLEYKVNGVHFSNSQWSQYYVEMEKLFHQMRGSKSN